MALLQLTGTAQPLAIYCIRLCKQAMFDIGDMLLYTLIAIVQCLVMVVP